MTMLKQLLSDNAMLCLQYAAGVLVPLFLIPHFVRTLGAVQYGRIAIAVATLGYASVIVQYAFHLTGPADLAHCKSNEDRKLLFLDIVFARLLLLVGVSSVAVCGLLLARFSRGADHGVHLSHWWVLLGIPIGASLNSGWYLQSTGRVAVLSILSIAAATCSLFVGFVFVGTDQQAAMIFAAVALALGPLLAGLGTFVWSLATLPPQGARPSWSRALNALCQGREIFVSQFVAAAYGLAGPIVVGLTAGESSAGLYSAVERIANALLTALGLTHVAAYPRLAMLYRTARSEYLRLVHIVLGLNALGIGLLGAFLWIGYEPLSRFVLAEVSRESALLLSLAWVWVAISVVGPLVTGYLTVSESRAEVLSLTWRVLLVSLPAGVMGVAFVGGPGWLAGLIVGQGLVVWRATAAYLQQRSMLRIEC